MRPVRRPGEIVGGSISNEGHSPSPDSTTRRGAIGLLAGLLIAPALVGASEAGAPGEEPIEIRDTVTVTETRLRDRRLTDDADEAATPAHVTVIGRGAIEGARSLTLQDLLATEAGIVLFDQVGDDVSKTLDLRGFGGSGTRVFLNGAPLNDPRNNSLALELVPLQQLERVEITRGSTAALAGGGSEAGVINLWTRRGGEQEGSLSIAAGEFDTLEATGSFAGRLESTDLALSGSLYETDGFRQNADGDLGRLSLDLGWDPSERHRLDLSIVGGAADFGNPGAATAGELAIDRERSFFNALDFTDEDFAQAALNLAASLDERWSLTANLFARDRDTEALTTGRAAPLFGGFFLETATEVFGTTLQLGYGRPDRERSHRLAAGLEWLDGQTDARGFATPAGDPALVSPDALSSDNVTGRRTTALYLQDRWQVSPLVTLTAGARYDRDEVGYRESFPDPANDAERDFSELSLRAGVSLSLSARHSVYASFGEAFLPPTVEELFAFPLFGSNPELRPQDSRSIEVGFRGRWRSGRGLDVSLFEIDTEDEIVFDPDSPLGQFGSNVNIGKALRRGIELSARGDLGETVRGFFNLTLVDPEFANGDHRGNTLPLVPEERLAAGIDVELPKELALRAVAQYVGEQVLDNDDANAAGRLDAYGVVDVRLSWAGAGERGLGLFAEVKNLFDERYATRGIFAFDFQTFVNTSFFSPAPGRRWMAGVEWGF